MRALYSWIAVAGFAAATASHAAPLLSEDFHDVAALGASGWMFRNLSAVPNEPWFQGNAGIFVAQAGAPDAYVAANFMSSDSGAILNLLITPELQLSGGEVLSFYTRADSFDGIQFDDNLAVALGHPLGGDLVFDTPLALIGPSLAGAAYPASWQHITAIVPPQAGRSGLRIGFAYVSGDAIDANYVGIDSVVVSVPEPPLAVLLGLGLGMLGFLRRGSGAGLPGLLAAAALTLAAAVQPVSAAEAQGQTVVRDPVTGRMRAPTHEEFRAMQEASRRVVQPSARSTATDAAAASAPEVEVLPGGAHRVRLGERAMTYSVVSRKADGTLSGLQCVTGERAAEAAVKGPKFAEPVLTREAQNEVR